MVKSLQLLIKGECQESRRENIIQQGFFAEATPLLISGVALMVLILIGLVCFGACYSWRRTKARKLPPLPALPSPDSLPPPSHDEYEDPTSADVRVLPQAPTPVNLRSVHAPIQRVTAARRPGVHVQPSVPSVPSFSSFYSVPPSSAGGYLDMSALSARNQDCTQPGDCMREDRL